MNEVNRMPLRQELREAVAREYHFPLNDRRAAIAVDACLKVICSRLGINEERLSMMQYAYRQFPPDGKAEMVFTVNGLKDMQP